MSVYRRRRRWLDRALVFYVLFIAYLMLAMCGGFLGLLIVLSRMMDS